jgi:hypothetical protein
MNFVHISGGTIKGKYVAGTWRMKDQMTPGTRAHYPGIFCEASISMVTDDLPLIALLLVLASVGLRLGLSDTIRSNRIKIW